MGEDTLWLTSDLRSLFATEWRLWHFLSRLSPCRAPALGHLRERGDAHVAAVPALAAGHRRAVAVVREPAAGTLQGATIQRGPSTL